MQILLVDGAPELAAAEDLRAAFVGLLEAKGMSWSPWDMEPARAVEAMEAAAKAGCPVMRYAGSDVAAPVFVAISSEWLAHFAGIEAPPPSGSLVVMSLPADVGESLPIFEPHGLLLPQARFARHLVLADRDLAGRPELFWFVDALREFTLTSLGCQAFLRASRWHGQVRLREEATGGLLFVPETSQLIELGADAFHHVRAAIDEGEPMLLAEGRFELRDRVIATLASAGAIVPVGVVS